MVDIQSVDPRWRHGAEWTVRVRYRQLVDNDKKDNAVLEPGCRQEQFLPGETTSTTIDGLAPDRQYLIFVDAMNEVGYNSSLSLRPIIIPNDETSKRLTFCLQETRSFRKAKRSLK